MKILIQNGNYTFTAAAKTVSLDAYGSIDIENILLITNVVDGIIIYNFADPAKGGTVATNVVTLDYDTTTMADTDELQIWYWDVNATQIVSIGAVDNTSVYSGTLSATGAITGIDTTGYESLVIQVTGQFIGTVIGEASNDNSIWNDVFFTPVDEPSRQQNIQEDGLFFIKCNAKYFRLNVTSYQSGSIVITILGRTVYGSQAVDNLSYAMDKTNLMPIYVEDINGPLKKDAIGAIVVSDGGGILYPFNKISSAGTTAFPVVLVETTGYQSIAVQVVTLTTTAANAQVSNDGVTWTAINGYASVTSLPITQCSAAGFYSFSTPGKYFRITQVGGGMAGFWTLKNQPASPLLSSNGLTPVTLSSIGSNTTGGVVFGLGTTGTQLTAISGALQVGGGAAPGATTVPYPVIVGGQEAASVGALGGKVRTLLTDANGRLAVAGTDALGAVQRLGVIPGGSNPQNIPMLNVSDQTQVDGQNRTEILAQMLIEMKIMNQYLFELPGQLQKVFNTLNNSNNIIDYGFKSEPQEFRNDPTFYN